MIQSSPILMAEDDPDDQLLTKMALQSAEFNNPFMCVNNGQELLDYLERVIQSDKTKAQLLPALIILDLNMPVLNGLDTLQRLRQHQALKSIPVVIFSTSSASDEIKKSYRSGANSYICKPNSFEALASIMRQLGRYWLNIVEVP